MKLSRRIGLTSVLLLGSALMLPAMAVESEPPADSGAHCALYLPTGDEACFSTLGASLSWVDSFGPGAVSLGATPMSKASDYLLARLYEDKNKKGWTYSVFATSPCDTHSGAEWNVATFNSQRNDEVSSFQGYSDCQVKLFENANFNATPGSTYGPFSSSNDVAQ